MIKNYLKIAWRNLIKDRQFTLLNFVGLSVGLACTSLIGLWVADAYRAPMGLEIFLFTALAAIGITLATIAFQAVRAARANPAGALRSE